MPSPSETRSWLMTAGLAYLVFTVIEKIDDVTTGESEEGLESLPGGLPNLEPPTLTEGRLSILADLLDQALLGSVYEVEEVVYGVYAQLCNEADVYALTRAFGVRCAWAGVVDCGTLTEAMVYYLDSDELAVVNGILANNGIQLRYVA